MRKFFLAVFIVLGVALFFLPQILSTRPAINLATSIIESATHLDVDIDSLHLSWWKGQRAQGVTFKDREFNGRIERVVYGGTLIDLIRKELRPLSIDTLNASYQGRDQYKEVDASLNLNSFKASGKTERDGVKGAFKLEGSFDQLLILNGELQNVPLGDLIDCKLATSNGVIAVTFDANRFHVSGAATVTRESIALKAPLKAQGMLLPWMISAITDEFAINATPFTLTLSHLTIPIPQWQNLEFAGQLTAQDLQLIRNKANWDLKSSQVIASTNNLQEGLKLSVKSDPLTFDGDLAFGVGINGQGDVVEFPFAFIEPEREGWISLDGTIDLHDEKGSVDLRIQTPELIVSRVKATISDTFTLLEPAAITYNKRPGRIESAQIPLEGDGPLNVQGSFDTHQFAAQGQKSDFAITIRGDHLKASSRAKLTQDRLTLLRPLKFQYTLTPTTYQSLMDSGYLALKESAQITGDIAPFSYPLTGPLNVSAQSDELNFFAVKEGEFITVKGATVEASVDMWRQALKGSYSASVDTGSVKGSLIIDNYTAPTQGSFDIIGERLPTSFFGLLLFDRPNLGKELGEQFSVDGTLVHTDDHSELGVDFKSENLTLKGSFELKEALKLKSSYEPASFRFTLKQPPITNPGTLRGKVTKLYWPLNNQALSRQLSDVRIEADLSMASLGLASPLSLHDLTAHIDKKKGSDQIPFGGSLNIDGKGTQGSLTFTGFVLDKGDHLGAKINLMSRSLPTELLDLIAPISPFIGQAFSLDAKGEISKERSDLDVIFQSPSFAAQTALTLNQSLLTLREPLNAQFDLNPIFQSTMKKRYGVDLLALKNPIQLYIDPKQFSLPLFPLNLSGFQLGYGVLDLGQMVVGNVGSAQDIGSIFQLPARSPSFPLWFAPTEFSARSGRLFLDRTEVLFNGSLDVALWGTIDLPRRYVDMILGLTAQSLALTLGVPNLSPNYVLKVPIRGPFDDVKIYKDEAAAKIAFLLARKHTLPRAGVWGNLLDTLGDLADDQSDVPPPKRPFPWER